MKLEVFRQHRELQVHFPSRLCLEPESAIRRKEDITEHQLRLSANQLVKESRCRTPAYLHMLKIISNLYLSGTRPS
jgi:hypothetical protein